MKYYIQLLNIIAFKLQWDAAKQNQKAKETAEIMKHINERILSL